MSCHNSKIAFETHLFSKCGYVEDGLSYRWSVNCGLVFPESSPRVKGFLFFWRISVCLTI